jgi:anhydro-N-acetylmuramic acid kinase
MSGTSLDGIDVALLRTDGVTVFERGPSETFAYSELQRTQLRQALADAVSLQTRDERPGSLRAVETAVTDWHRDAVLKFMASHAIARSNIDVIGFHGQTVLHRPEQRLTVQIGDGAALSRALGVTVAYDMRAADVAEGGHQALAASLTRSPVAFVNIGGVGNVTWCGPDGELVAFDTGPGNALIDDWMFQHTGAARDLDGGAALRGKGDEAAVAQFLGDGYYEKAAPKSLDRNSFAGVSLAGLVVEDGAATLTAVTVRSIALSARHFPSPPVCWIICGGGRKNKAIMRGLESLLGDVKPAEAYDFNGDSMEAEAWAFLAVRCLRGLPISFPNTTGAPQPLTGGVIARPLS